MRKSSLQKIIEQNEIQLKSAQHEIEQLNEKLKSARKKAEDLENAEKAENDETKALCNEIDELKAQLEAENARHKAETELLNAKLAAVSDELARLKGDFFDLSAYADELKQRLEVAESSASFSTTAENSSKTEVDASATTVEAPHISAPYTADDIDKDLFDYASGAISRVIIKSSKVKNAIAGSSHELGAELLPLAVGKTEMLKSDILQVVISNENDEEKRKIIDNLAAEALEYYDGLLGQIV